MDKDMIRAVYRRYSTQRPISEGICRTMFEAVKTGALSGGEKVTEEDLAALFSVSRTPIREAIKRLLHEDILVLDPHWGYMVKVYTEKECLDLFELLAVLQSAAVSLAARRITSSCLAVLEDNIAQAESATDVRVQNELNTAFHLAVAEGTNNPYLIQDIRAVYRRLFVLEFSSGQVRFRDDYLDEHRQLLDALRQGDADWALSIHQRHIDRTRGGFIQSAMKAQRHLEAL